MTCLGVGDIRSFYASVTPTVLNHDMVYSVRHNFDYGYTGAKGTQYTALKLKRNWNWRLMYITGVKSTQPTVIRWRYVFIMSF